MTEWYIIVHICHIYFIHPSAEGHLGWFVIVNNDSMNIRNSFDILISTSLDAFPDAKYYF
jgi:hypothetical protein